MYNEQKTNISLYCEARQFVNNLLLIFISIVIFTIIGNSGSSAIDIIIIIAFVTNAIILISHNARGHNPYLLIKIYILSNMISWIPTVAKDVQYRLNLLADEITINGSYDLKRIDHDYKILIILQDIVSDIINKAIIEGVPVNIIVPDTDGSYVTRFTKASWDLQDNGGRCYCLSREDTCGLIVDFENLLLEIKSKLAKIEPIKLLQDKMIDDTPRKIYNIGNLSGSYHSVC